MNSTLNPPAPEATRPPCIAIVKPMSPAVRAETEKINANDEAIEVDESKLARDAQKFVAKFAELYRQLVADAQAEGVELRERKEKLLERKTAHAHRVHAHLPKCAPAYRQAIIDNEAIENDCRAYADDRLREIGIDELSCPGGEHLMHNPEAMAIQWRHRLNQELEVQNAVSRTNRARNALQVLESRFPILPSHESVQVKLPIVGAPEFIAAMLK